MPSAALERHPATPCAALRRIAVSVERRSRGALRVAFTLEGEINGLRIAPRRAPQVGERLWQHTCCEVFVGRHGRSGYREFNLSPSREWAAFDFERYREGSALDIRDPGIAVARSATRLELAASLPAHAYGELLIGLAAVIEDATGVLSYWALRHAPGKPDFHHRAAFALELDAVRN